MSHGLSENFPCSKCGEQMKVVDSRPTTGAVRRMRKCKVCGHKCTTYELEIPLRGEGALIVRRAGSGQNGHLHVNRLVHLGDLGPLYAEANK